jgi:hypothetical protein
MFRLLFIFSSLLVLNPYQKSSFLIELVLIKKGGGGGGGVWVGLEMNIQSLESHKLGSIHDILQHYSPTLQLIFLLYMNLGIMQE